VRWRRRRFAGGRVPGRFRPWFGVRPARGERGGHEETIQGCGEGQGGRSGGAAAARDSGAPASVRGRGEAKPRGKRGGKGSLPHRGAATVVRAEDWRRRCRIAVAQELGRRRRKSERRHGGARAGGESWGRQRRLRGNVRKGSQLRRGGPRRAVIRLTEPPLLTGLS
jgi:hypothetical protein